MKLYQKFKQRILPHEILWLVYLTIQSLLLLYYTPSSLWTVFSFGMIAVIVGLVFCPNTFIRLGAYVLIMNGMFQAVGYISPLINPRGHVDSLLNGIDLSLFGGNLSIALEPYAHPVLTEILSIAYMLFMVQLFLSFLLYLFRTGQARQRFYVGLMSLYALGFIGYILFPAYGPYLYLKDSFSDPLNAGIFRDLLNWCYPKGTNYTDVFPSLHCGVSLFILGADYFYNKKAFKIWLPICLLLWFSTVYLRYHYMIDCIVGFMLAIICLYWMQHYHYKKGDTNDKRCIF